MCGHWALPRVFQDVFGYNSPESSPWRYDVASTGDTKLVEDATITTYGYTGDTAVPDLGFTGTQRYAAEVDLGWLYVESGYNGYFLSKFTMECGNDNLIGQGTVPEPATMLLLGSGLIGMAAFGRRKFRKN